MFMLLLAAVAVVAIWCAHDMQQRHNSLQHRSAVAASLQDARALVFQGTTLLVAMVFAKDPAPLADSYREATAAQDQALDEARSELVALDEMDGLAALDGFTEQSAHTREEVDAILGYGLTADLATRIAVGQQHFPELWPDAEAQMARMDELAAGQQTKLAAERAAADRSSASTVALLIGLSTLAFLGGSVALIGLIMSVVRPLAALQASARAVASGDLGTRVRVSGPEETASLARDFNEMVSQRRRAEEALREQARRDSLTGVLNHAAIVEQLRDLIPDEGGGSSHAIAMVDVDGLKATNDTYGHQAGDAVLVAVAHTLSKDGATVGRYGGDEFVALLPGANRADAEGYRDTVLQTLADAALADPETGASVPVTISVGLVVYPTEAWRIEDLIKLADSEMYAAKRQRPVGATGRTLPQPLGDERAARMVGELVPLLTSPGNLDDKLRLVARRLSVGAGYDGVNFGVFGSASEPLTTQAVFADAPDEAVEVWNREHRQAAEHPLRATLERTRLPIILDELQHDERLTDGERELLCEGGLRSGLIAPMIWQNEVIGSLSVASKREAAFAPSDAQFLMAVATQVTAIVHMATLVEELKSASTHLGEAHTETVMLLAAAAEAHDHTTGLHLQNVRAVTETLAQELGYSQEDTRELGLAAVLHDIGKIRVPDTILSTAGRLTEGEWEVMKRHSTWGEEFLKGRPGFELAATIARSHHEHWDGSGYPDGLAGDDIPEAATIVALADAFDAMISDRPYRAARSVAAALQEIAACSGRHFSPRVAQAIARLDERKMLPHALGEPTDQKAAA
jgi:diguanylate cyclase (GGDEF)-like protein